MSRAWLYLRAFPSILRIGFAEMVAYRAEMVVWILTSTLPLVMLALWNTAAADGPLQGYSQIDFARYFTVTLVVRQLTATWLVWELNYEVRTGSLSPLLLRPMHPLVFNAAETLAAVPFRMVVLLPIVGALLLWRPEIAFTPSASQLLLGCISVVLAFMLAWSVQAIFGMLAFWFEQSLGLYNLWLVGIALLGGYVIPLSLLPPKVTELGRWLPFHASLGAPVEIFIGTAPYPEATVLAQAAWVAVCALGAGLMWRRGIRRYGAVGA